MVTDGTFVCGLCGEWSTGCNLCYQAPLVDMRRVIAFEEKEQREAEIELRNQERAIRKAAENRRGL